MPANASCPCLSWGIYHQQGQLSVRKCRASRHLSSPSSVTQGRHTPWSPAPPSHRTLPASCTPAERQVWPALSSVTIRTTGLCGSSGRPVLGLWSCSQHAWRVASDNLRASAESRVLTALGAPFQTPPCCKLHVVEGCMCLRAHFYVHVIADDGQELALQALTGGQSICWLSCHASAVLVGLFAPPVPCVDVMKAVGSLCQTTIHLISQGCAASAPHALHCEC